MEQTTQNGSGVSVGSIPTTISRKVFQLRADKLQRHFPSPVYPLWATRWSNRPANQQMVYLYIVKLGRQFVKWAATTAPGQAAEAYFACFILKTLYIFNYMKDARIHEGYRRTITLYHMRAMAYACDVIVLRYPSCKSLLAHWSLYVRSYPR